MAHENAIPPPDVYREVALTELRQKRKIDSSKDWTTDSARIADDPEDSFVSSFKPPERDTRLDPEFNRALSKKARHDLDNAYEGIAGGDAAREDQPSSARKPHGGLSAEKAEPVTESGGADKMSAVEFMAKDKGIATDENSTVLSGSGDEAGGSGGATATPEEVSGSLKMTTKNVGGSGEKKATIGTFNIEWLGKKERTEEDYRNIAQVIKDSDAAMLGIQEIADVEGLKKVMKHLPDHGYILGKSGDQMVGMIFDKNRVKYDANSIDLVEEVTLGNPRMRPPLSVDVKVDDYDFNFTVLHLKAGFKDGAIATRHEQADVLNAWAKDKMARSADKDMIIVGDYNDFVGSDTLSRAKDGGILDFVTREAGKGFYSNVKYYSIIDHAALSSAKGGASEEYVPGSLRTIDERKYPSYTYTISDHKPVLFDVRTGLDND
jgi:endonuclease/exonuclease/phosphatase family metal-dependent hydrolase